MWGTAQPRAKLTDDSGSGFEAALIGDCRLFRLFRAKISRRILGVLQHYPKVKRISQLRATISEMTEFKHWL